MTPPVNSASQFLTDLQTKEAVPHNRLTMMRMRRMSPEPERVSSEPGSPDEIVPDVAAAVRGLLALHAHKPIARKMDTTPPSSPRRVRSKLSTPMKSRRIGPVHGSKAIPSCVIAEGNPLSHQKRYEDYLYMVVERRATGNKFPKGAEIVVWVPRGSASTIERGSIHFWRVHYHGANNTLSKTRSSDTHLLWPTGETRGEFVQLKGEIPQDVFSGSRWGAKCARGPRFFMGVIQVESSGLRYTTIPYHTEISPTAKEPRYRDPVPSYGENILYNIVELARRGDARQ